jgi:hypothetical protein
MPIEQKPWYQSKVVLVNLVMGMVMMVSQFSPELAEVLKQYLGTEAAIGWALINIVLRLFKSNVVL